MPFVAKRLTETELPPSFLPFLDLGGQVMSKGHRLQISRTCSRCESTHLLFVSEVRFRIKKGTFRATCQECSQEKIRTLAKRQRQQPLTEDELPEVVRPFFDLSSQKSMLTPSGLHRLHVERTCSECGDKRMVTVKEIRLRAEREEIGSLCVSCYHKGNAARLSGSKNPQWNGGRHITNGYVFILSPDHPNRNRMGRGYVAEHRLVMEKVVGRYLYPWETVHHLNGDRADNRPENLELWNKAHPHGVRAHQTAPHCPTCRCHEIHEKAS